MAQHNMENEATTINDCRQFSIPRYLCQKLNMFGRGKLYATSKRHARLRVRGAECILLESSQGGLLSLSPSMVRTHNIFSHSVKAWLSPSVYNSVEDSDHLQHLHALQAADRDKNVNGDQMWGTGLGFKIDNLGFPEAPPQKKSLRQILIGRPEKEIQTGPLRAPSCRTPEQLAMQVESYSLQVTELKERINSMQIILWQEEERRKITEEQAMVLRENLSREVVEAQRLELRTEFEQQERATIASRLSILSETVAQGYGHQEDAELRRTEETCAISRSLNPHEFQLVSQLREAKCLLSVAVARIEALKVQVKELEVFCDSVKTYQKVCHHRQTAWKHGLLTLVQAMLICLGLGIVFGREPIFFGSLIPS